MREKGRKPLSQQSLIPAKAQPNRGRVRRVPDATAPKFASLRIYPDLTALLPRAWMGI